MTKLHIISALIVCVIMTGVSEAKVHKVSKVCEKLFAKISMGDMSKKDKTLFNKKCNTPELQKRKQEAVMALRTRDAWRY